MFDKRMIMNHTKNLKQYNNLNNLKVYVTNHLPRALIDKKKSFQTIVSAAKKDKRQLNGKLYQVTLNYLLTMKNNILNTTRIK